MNAEVIRRCLSHGTVYTSCTDRSWGGSVRIGVAGPYCVLSMPGHTLFARVTEDTMHVVINTWLFNTRDQELSRW